MLLAPFSLPPLSLEIRIREENNTVIKAKEGDNVGKKVNNGIRGGITIIIKYGAI